MNKQRMLCMAALAAMSLCFAVTTQVKGQERAAIEGGSPQLNYSRELLKRPSVQKELGLDDQQKADLAKVLNRSNRPIVVRPVVSYTDISRLSNEERKQWQAEIHRQAAEQTAFVMNERQREMDEILRPDQRQRLTEIDLQFRGVLALGSKTLSDRLGISTPHQQCIAQILSDFEVKRLTLLRPTEKSEDINAPLYQKRRALLQESEQEVLVLLSDEEMSRWAQAVGRPFVFEN